VEAGIGTIKGSKYGFNRPAARLAAIMGACGQRAVFGIQHNQAGARTGWAQGHDTERLTAYEVPDHEIDSGPAGTPTRHTAQIGGDIRTCPAAHRANDGLNYPTSCSWEIKSLNAVN
jgi:hypothetical protein